MNLNYKREEPKQIRVDINENIIQINLFLPLSQQKYKGFIE